MKQNLITRCSICKTIVLEGIKMAFEDYSEKELLEKGFHFSDGILSRECCESYYPGLTSLEDKFSYESCKVPKPKE